MLLKYIRCPCCIRKGFSFMEILFCICAIVALSSGAFIVGGHILTVGRYNDAKTELATISTAISQYHFEMGKMPADLDVLNKVDGQYGPWLPDEDFNDPWGNKYNYSSKDGIYVVSSNGADKTAGTNDDIKVSGVY